MSEQQKAAYGAANDWLAMMNGGRAVNKLEETGHIIVDGLRYYMFRFKKGGFGKWELAVCGGYVGEGVERPVYVVGKNEAYRKETAQQDAARLVQEVIGAKGRFNNPELTSFMGVEPVEGEPAKMPNELEAMFIDMFRK